MVVHMAVIAVWLNINGKGVASELQEAAEKLDSSDGEVIVDFASVRRIDSSALRAMQGFAGKADEKAVKVVLRSVSVEVYRVLKLMKLAPRFTFASRDVGRPGEELLHHAESSTK
jgi:anti-anti-sigma regulatory factor